MADLVPAILYSPTELWATAWFRARLIALAASRPVLVGMEVDSKEPSVGSFPAKLLVVQGVGGPGDYFTAERVLTLNVLAGTKENPQDADEIMGIALGLVWQMPGSTTVTDPRNPVASVTEINGPYPVDEAQSRARRYANATLVVTPEPL